MNTDRLERLAVLLEKDAANPQGIQFDMSYWSKLAEAGNRYCFIDGKAPTVDCGTQACAFGLAAISGVFKEDGLGFEISEGMLIPTFEGAFEYEAAMQFFDINFKESQKLFDPWEYNARKGAKVELEVVRRIRHLIAHGNFDTLPL